MRKLKYILNDLRWLKVLNSPFKPFKVRLYVGKTQVGVPYFLPRKWVKATPKRAAEAALRQIADTKRYNELNPQYARKEKSFGELHEEYMRYRFPVPLTVGFSYCGLGWKTKWTDTDFRHEWNPVLSFVFFGYQIALTVYSKNNPHYWESWLCYEYATDKTKSKRERLKECREKCPQIWSSHKDGVETIIDYYELTVKPKYLK